MPGRRAMFCGFLFSLTAVTGTLLFLSDHLHTTGINSLSWSGPIRYAGNDPAALCDSNPEKIGAYGSITFGRQGRTVTSAGNLLQKDTQRKLKLKRG